MNYIRQSLIELLKKDIEKAKDDMYNSLCWYEYKIIPLMDKYKTPIDGNFNKRIWYFVLTLVS